MRLGSQVFVSSAFNANIGAWNTASVTSLSYVCATFGRWRAMQWTRSANVRCGVAVVRDGTTDACARARAPIYIYVCM